MPTKSRKTARADIDIRSLARGYTKVAIQTLGGIAKAGEGESARVSAAIALLDRGWGRPAQPLTGKDGEREIEVTIRTIMGEKKK